jgi:hypothetical protein
MNLCNAILAFVLVFNDGHKENREKWVTSDVGFMFAEKLQDPEYMKDLGVKSVENITVKTVQPYDCNVGPWIQVVAPTGTK